MQIQSMSFGNFSDRRYFVYSVNRTVLGRLGNGNYFSLRMVLVIDSLYLIFNICGINFPVGGGYRDLSTAYKFFWCR